MACTSDFVGAGPSSPIAAAEAFPGAMEQMYPYHREASSSSIFLIEYSGGHFDPVLLELGCKTAEEGQPLIGRDSVLKSKSLFWIRSFEHDLKLLKQEDLGKKVNGDFQKHLTHLRVDNAWKVNGTCTYK